MKVTYGRRTHEFDRPMTVKRLLKELDIVPEGVVVSVNGSLTTSDRRVEVDDEVEIIRAISGGRAALRGPGGTRCGHPGDGRGEGARRGRHPDGRAAARAEPTEPHDGLPAGRTFR